MFWKVFSVIARNTEIINYYKEHNKEHPTAAGITAVLVMSVALMMMGLTLSLVTAMAMFNMLDDPALLMVSGFILALFGFIMQIVHGVLGEWLGNQKSRKEQQESSTEPE